MPVKPEVLAVRDLGKAVDAAVKISAVKHQVAAEAGPVLKPGIICGRYLKEAIEAKAALDFATDVARQVGRGNEPAVLLTNKGILCGFIPVEKFGGFGL